MAGHITEVVGIVFLLIFAATMFYHGTMILHGKGGYRNCHRDKRNSENMRRRIEALLKDK